MPFENPALQEGSVHYAAHPSAFARENLIYPEFVGRFVVTPQYRTLRLCFDNSLLMAVSAGRIHCACGEMNASAGPGELLLLDCRQPHAYYASEPSDFCFVHFSGAQTEPLVARIHAAFGLMVPTRAFDEVYGLMEGLLARIATRTGTEALASADLYRILMLLLGDAAIPASPEERRTVEHAQAYILAHLSERLTLDRLAALSGYSAGYFSRLFKRATGYTPYSFILKARLDHAQRLLLGSELSMQEIAEQSGFPSQANFSHTFRKSLGVTPREYRKDPLL